MLPRALLPFVLAPLLLAGCALPAASPSDAAPPMESGADVRFDGVRFETDHGAFTAILFPGQTPETVRFFTGLVEAGYYDGREFNRVIPGFVIQEVDRAGGATDQPETVVGEFGTDVMFSAGALGIARSEDPDSGGSEFFVMDFAHSHLYGNYTAFAQVVDGLDVVRSIARVETVQTPGAFVPGLPVGLHDRVAVEPGRIESARLVDVTLPAAAAARYPLVVGPTVRVDEGAVRYTLEWPASLSATVGGSLAWYVYTRDGSVPADIESYAVRVEGPGVHIPAVATLPDPADPRVRTFSIDGLGAAGGYEVSLLDGDGRALATTIVPVR